ncbi:MAG: hypothetical protein EA349_00540 [Halomonadaceae bacterium]|nr:MAG: hypothetical protein EA349_00540 [Halomonadaceae bacterium]
MYQDTVVNAPATAAPGRADRLVNSQCSRTLAQRWQCSLHEHHTAGHALPQDDPDWVVMQIKPWGEQALKP